MKITIFAATGGIGRQVLEQAVAAGHDVTAVVRNPRNLPSAEPICPKPGRPQAGRGATTLCTLVADQTAGEAVFAARYDAPVTIPLRDLAEGNPHAQRSFAAARE